MMDALDLRRSKFSDDYRESRVNGKGEDVFTNEGFSQKSARLGCLVGERISAMR
jgi:hypothetical protein